MRVLPIVNRAVNGNGPHAGSVAITVTVIVLTAVPTRPDVDVTQSVSTLKSTESEHDVLLGFGAVTTRLSTRRQNPGRYHDLTTVKTSNLLQHRSSFIRSSFRTSENVPMFYPCYVV